MYICFLFCLPKDVHGFFAPHCTLVWEGTAVQGTQQLSNLFSMLPPTKHVITSLDAHCVGKI